MLPSIALLFSKLNIFVLSISCSKPHFFFIPTWYEYLKLKPDDLGQCAPVVTLPGDFLTIGLAFLDMMLRLAGFIAVVSIIISGIDHMFSGGEPQKAAAARHRLFNSLIGLAIAFVATAVVSFVGRQFT